MRIIIKKKAAEGQPAPAPVVSTEAPAVVEKPKTDPATGASIETAEEVKQRWVERMPPPAPPKICKFCGHPYLQPCMVEKEAKSCGNWWALEKERMAKEKAAREAKK